jgi:hypothetical protein
MTQDVVCWVPSPHPSIVNLPLSSRRNSSNSSSHHNYYSEEEEQEQEDEDDQDIINIMTENDNINGGQEDNIDYYEFPLDNLEMIKVLGKGCMGKVNKKKYHISLSPLTYPLSFL